MAGSGAIRAGRAFVEMFIDDATVKGSLDTVRAKLQAFGAVVDASATASLARMATTSVAGTTATTASVGVMAGAMGILRSSIVSVGIAWRSVMGVIATSVIRATISLGALSMLVARVAPTSKVAGLLNGFLSKSQTTEAIGRWTRFAGAITGSKEIKNIGNQIQRLGLGSAIISGFQKGVGSGLLATLGATYRSAKTILIGGLASVLSSPIRAAAGVAGTVRGILGAPFRAVSSVVSGGAAAATAGAAGGPVATTAKALSAPATAITGFGSAAGSALSSVAKTISSVSLKFIGLASAISIPATMAAKSFATSAAEIMAKSREAGESLQSLIDKKFGVSGLISPADIRLGAELSEAYAKLRQSIATAWAQVGIAVLPLMIKMTRASIDMANALSMILSRNRPLISSIVSTALAVLKTSAAIFALVKAWAILTPVVAALLSPLSLFAIAVVGIVYLFPQLQKAGLAAFNYLYSGFKILAEIANQTIGGIRDALTGGDLQAAARMLWAGLNLAWLTGSADLRSIWQTMVTGMANTFTNLWASLRSGWISTQSLFLSTWQATQNVMESGISKMMISMTSLLGMNTRNSPTQEQVAAVLKEDQGRAAKARNDAANAELKNIEANRRASEDANIGADEAARKRAVEDLKNAQAEFNAARAAAAAARAKGAKTPAAKGAASALGAMFGTATMGTFSGAALGRQQIGGISSLSKSTQDTAENTKKIADNTDPKNGLAFA